MVPFKGPIFGRAACCPLPSIHPRCSNTASLGPANTATKLQFASVQRFFQKVYGSVHKRAIVYGSTDLRLYTSAKLKIVNYWLYSLMHNKQNLYVNNIQELYLTKIYFNYQLLKY
jgi:hypothetical protein